MGSELNKWLQTFRIAGSNQLAYKVNFLLLIIGPTVVFFFIKYNLWSAIYEMDGVSVIQGYSFRQMLDYQIWVMMVTFLGQGHNSMALAEDIRLGRISSYLIYPFEFWKFHAASFFAFQGIQIFVAATTLVILLGSNTVSDFSWLNVAPGVGFSLIVGVVWFSIQFVLGLMAFWLEETWVLRVMFLTVAAFLSGAIVPLEIYPNWLVNLLYYSPFPYLTYVPVKLFMGQYDGSFLQAAMIMLGWLIAVTVFAQLVWRRGLKLYTAAGM